MAPGKDQGSLQGGRPEQPGKQGTHQDKHPVKHHGMFEVLAVQGMGGHGSLLV